MGLQGKGFFIWKIVNCEGGNAEAIGNEARAAGYTHVLIKIANGVLSSNVDTTSGFDRAPAVVQALRARGISPWGWHYVYGNDPIGEARKAIERLRGLGLDGYVIDAEAEYKQSGKSVAAQRFMTEMRAAFPNLPMALCSYRFPSYHPQLPWREFLEKCDYNMPQVYWELAHNPASQLSRSVREFQGITPFRPVFPTGPTYKVNGWAPTGADITEFLNTARSLNLTGANFFSWDECRRDLSALWTQIQDYPWGGSSPQPMDVPQQFIAALNTHNPDQVAGLYSNTAVHITSARTIQGIQAIRSWYSTFLNQILPSGNFTLTGSSGSGTSRNFTWHATSSAGKVLNGNDTLGLASGKISYHYSSFTVTR